MSDQADIPAAQLPKTPHRRSFAAGRAIIALMLREMSTTYGRSPGGYVWAVLEPVAGIALLTFAFSLLFAHPPIGNSFAMFYATGVLTFTMFNDLHNKVSQALLYSKALLAYPNVTFLDALLARLLLNTITQLLVCYIVFGGAMFLYEGWMRIDLGTIVMTFALTALLAFGVGTLNSFIYMKIPVWQQLWSVMMRPMFLISGAMMLYTAIPQPYRDWLWWNPLVHLTGLMRRGFYEGYDAEYASPLYVLMVAMVCLTLGLLFLKRHYRDMLANT